MLAWVLGWDLYHQEALRWVEETESRGVQYRGIDTPRQVRTGTEGHKGGTPDSVLGPGMFSMEKCIELRPKGPVGMTQLRNPRRRTKYKGVRQWDQVIGTQRYLNGWNSVREGCSIRDKVGKMNSCHFMEFLPKQKRHAPPWKISFCHLEGQDEKNNSNLG